MTTQIIELIGYVAATLTTLAFAPQAWLTWKTRQTDGISLGMYAIFTSGVALWLIYGWMILNPAVTHSLPADFAAPKTADAG